MSVHLLGAAALGHGLHQRLVDVATGSAAARPRCAAGRTRARSRGSDMKRSYISRATDLGRMFSCPTQGCLRANSLNVRVDEVAVGLGPLELLELRHPLVVLHALRLHLGDLLALELVELRVEHDVRVLEDRLDQRQHVQRVRLRGRGSSLSQRVEQVQRQRVVQREVALQLRADLHDAPAHRLAASHARRSPRRAACGSSAARRASACRRFCVVARRASAPMSCDQPPVAAAAAPSGRSAGRLSSIAVRHLEARLQRLGRAVHAAARTCSRSQCT